MKFAEEAAEPGYAARGPGERPVGVEAVADEDVSAETSSGVSLHPGTDSPSLTELLRMALDEDAWEAISRGSAIRRAGRAGFARNVCVALGNWLAAVDRPDPAVVELLVRALDDPEPLVRGHAAWALGRPGSAAARASLSEKSMSEGDPLVRGEIAAALEA